jgi:hypothetical protein
MSENPVIDPTQTAAAAVSRAVYDVAIESSIKAAQVKVPFLAAPVISFVFSALVKKFAGLVYDHIEGELAFIIIDLKVTQQNRDYQNALFGLEYAVNAEKPKEVIDARREELKEKLRRLISLRNP